MASKNYLSKLDTILTDAYKEKSGRLEEKQVEMSLDINDFNRKYLLYSFDKIVKTTKGGKAIDLQPYFTNSEGVKKMCDYFLFCWEKGKLFVLLIELKQGEEQVTKQLEAGKVFATFLVSTLNRVEKLNIKPVIRKISVQDSHIIRKGTSMKSVVYDKNSFCTFDGSVFVLPEFLK